jgi:hypothetical protein
MRKTWHLAGIAALALAAPVAYGWDGDTSADVDGFASTLNNAPGVVLRVPIDAEGRENSSSAELRVAERTVASPEEVETAFARGLATTGQPQITGQDISTDSSTCGFFSYQYNWGWSPAYYYYNYTPTYYSGGYYYTYTTPYYYYSNFDYGYRYYYYPRYFSW